MKRALLVLAVACHTPSVSDSPSSSSSSSSVAQSAAPLPTPTPSAITTAPPPIASATPEAPKYIDDLAAWLRARGAKVPQALENTSCTEAKLGTSDALLCHDNPDSLPTGESVYPLSVWIIASGKAERALATAIGAGPLDREFMPGEPAPDDMYIELDATIDGSTLTIAERPTKTCNAVLAQYKSSETAGHRRVVQKACAARGKYVLQNGKLVRTP